MKSSFCLFILQLSVHGSKNKHEQKETRHVIRLQYWAATVGRGLASQGLFLTRVLTTRQTKSSRTADAAGVLNETQARRVCLIHYVELPGVGIDSLENK